MLNRIFQRTEGGRAALLESHDTVAASDLRLLMRFNGYTPLGLLRDALDDAQDLVAAVERLRVAGLIEPVTARRTADTGPTADLVQPHWGARASMLAASAP